MNGRGQYDPRRNPPGGPPRGGGDHRGPATPARIADRLRDRERVVYFNAPSPAPSKSAPTSKAAPRPELFGDEAEQLAKRLAGIPASQLRRFYSVVRTIKRQLDLDPNLGIDFIKSELALLKAKAAYALARLNYQPEGEKNPDELLTLFVRHGNSVEDRDSFNAFVRHFEAIMAYHKVFEDKRANR